MKAKPRPKSLRPKKSRWALAFCCNNPDSGQSTGKVDAIRFGIGRGNFAFGTDYVDDHELLLNGKPIGFRWLLPLGFRLSRKKYPCMGITYGVGNWCWDACFVSTNTVRQVAHVLKGKNWQPDSGSEWLWDWFTNLGRVSFQPIQKHELYDESGVGNYACRNCSGEWCVCPEKIMATPCMPWRNKIA